MIGKVVSGKYQVVENWVQEVLVKYIRHIMLI